MKPLIVLDFDRTTFMTEQFVTALIDLLAPRLDISETTYRDEITQYSNSPLLSYDFYRHIEEGYGIGALELTQLVEDGLKGQTFVYDDVAPWLARHKDYDVRILTTGRNNYQTLKHRLSPELGGLPFEITAEIKGGVLAHMIIDQEITGEVWLIDDNPASFGGLTVSPEMKLFHIKRPGTRFASAETPTAITPIQNFTQLPQ